ncbi:MAG: PhnD/SsuA/transferrin family substrate-binding protein [Pseudomonadota bacterium]
MSDPDAAAASIASLPMYDFPELRPQTEALWRRLRTSFLDHGLSAPATLTRPDDLLAHWSDPALFLSQTCGLPFATKLKDNVICLGTPAYERIGCAPGSYCSEIVVRVDADAADLTRLGPVRVAINEWGSQSGRAALEVLLASLGPNIPPITEVIVTRGHRDSLRAVAADRADLAAIDCVTWQLARDQDPAAKRLRVLARTPQTPGLPLITSKANVDRVDAMRAAVTDALADLDPDIRRAMLICGFVPRDGADYGSLPIALADAASEQVFGDAAGTGLTGSA